MRKVLLAGVGSRPSEVAVSQQRGIKILQTAAAGRPLHYSSTPRLKAGMDISPKFTEFFDGSTDDFGVFKEGPAATIRLEYLRQPEHTDADTVQHRYLWSPFEAHATSRTYSPLHDDYQHHDSKDQFGHRSGSYPGQRPLSHYATHRVCEADFRCVCNYFPLRGIPKWLASVVNDQKGHRFIGFFLYANGAYVAELLTYKQLPRLIYNKPFQGTIPTLGQAVTLSEVTYGKEVHSLAQYPGMAGHMAIGDGESAVILRGTEPDLVPVLLPSKEIRLFEADCAAVFGRRAGVLRPNTHWAGQKAGWIRKYIPTRPRVRMKSLGIYNHAAAGGNGLKANMKIQLDWKQHPFQGVKTRHWLNAYTLKHGRYTKGKTLSELKAKSYSWASRDPLYRTAYPAHNPFHN